MLRLMSLLAVLSLSTCSSGTTTPSTTHQTKAKSVTTKATTSAQPTERLPLILELNKPKPLPSEYGGTIELTSYTIESIEENPVNPESYPAGSGVVMSIAIDGVTVEVSDLSEGYSSFPIAWPQDYKVTLLRHDPSTSKVEVWIDHLSDEVVETVAQETRLNHGESLTFGEMTMVFEGHSHRRVREGQSPSLLMFATYRQGSYQLAKENISLAPPEKTKWRFHDYEFEMTDYEYDKFVVVNLRRLKLHPVEVAK